MAREVGFVAYGEDAGEYRIPTPAFHGRLERFASLVAVHTLSNIDPSKFMSHQEGFEAGAAAEREKLAHWMWSLGYAIHGDTIEDLLDHLGTQIAERLEAEALMERKQYEHTLALQKASYEREIKIEVEAEREACAEVAVNTCVADASNYPLHIAAAIRARSKT
jgi:hypothetical protein